MFTTQYEDHDLAINQQWQHTAETKCYRPLESNNFHQGRVRLIGNIK